MLNKIAGKQGHRSDLNGTELGIAKQRITEFERARIVGG